MTITAKIVADSVSPAGARITTMELRYPRFIHSELMTHRAFSRNASSSRAIPVERLIADVVNDTAMPIHWGKNQPGMQAREEHDARVRIHYPESPDGPTSWLKYGTAHEAEHFQIDYQEVSAENAWLCAMEYAVLQARALVKAGYHKQIVNRLLEPFAHINVVVTATDWENFFNLRIHEAAQPEIFQLAVRMKLAMDNSYPTATRLHLPYVLPEELDHPSVRMISAARCARVSYKTHDGRAPNLEEDLALSTRLLGPPLHASPFEHQATSLASPTYRSANFRGWQQFRQEIEQ